MDAFLQTNIIDGPVVGVVHTLALGALLYLAVRRPTRRDAGSSPESPRCLRDRWRPSSHSGL